ncbi:hypothetical protein [Massilia timonae]|nr:hypothetical protein [Massilia timonae]
MALLDDPSPDFDTARARLDDRVFAIDCDQVDQVLDEYILRTRVR